MGGKRKKCGQTVNDGNHIYIYILGPLLMFFFNVFFYHHFRFFVTFASSKLAWIHQQQQNRLNFAPKSISASLSESRPCFWREIRFVELRGPLRLTSPALIKQTAWEQLLVYKWQSHFISQRLPQSKKPWMSRVTHPSRATANQRSALAPWPSPEVIPSQQQPR